MTAISQDFKACRALDMPDDGSRKLLGAVLVIVSVDGENRALDIFEVRNNRPRPELWRQPKYASGDVTLNRAGIPPLYLTWD